MLYWLYRAAGPTITMFQRDVWYRKIVAYLMASFENYLGFLDGWRWLKSSGMRWPLKWKEFRENFPRLGNEVTMFRYLREIFHVV